MPEVKSRTTATPRQNCRPGGSGSVHRLNKSDATWALGGWPARSAHFMGNGSFAGRLAARGGKWQAGPEAREHRNVPGRKPILESELPRVYEALATFPLRDQTLVTLGLDSGSGIRDGT